MDITVSIKPDYDTYNKRPPKTDFEISDDYVTIVCSPDTQGDIRTLRFDKEDFKGVAKLIEE
jgi:hypothetical protein